MRLVAWGISVINFFFVIYYNNDLKEIQRLYSWVEEELIKMSEIFKLQENGYDVTVFMWKNVGEVADFIAATTGLSRQNAELVALDETRAVGQVHCLPSGETQIHVATWFCSSPIEVEFVVGHELGHLNGNRSPNGVRCNQIEGRCDAWGARYAALSPRQMARFIRNASRTPREFRERLRSAIQEIRSW